MMDEEEKCSGCDLRCVEVGVEIKLRRYVEIERNSLLMKEGRKEGWRL
jgi:hypothetical protein